MNKTTFRFGKNAIGKLLFTVLFIFTCQLLSAQVTIASDGLNNSTTLFTLSGGAYYTGNSATGDRVASSPFAVEGTHSYGLNAPSTATATATMTTSNINTSAYTGISATFRLAAFSIGSTTNGLDGTDIVTVSVSPDGGTTYYSTVRVLGNGNAYWSYSGGTSVASTSYDGNATPVDFTSAAGNAGSGGYSTVTVTGLPAITNLRVRITLTNNATSERWVVDDFKVSGTLAPVGPTVTTTAATSVTTSGATLNGTIDANNTATNITFEYGTTVSYGSSVAATPASLSDDTATAVSATIGSLALNTLYNYRTVGTVGGTPTNGNNITFYTLAATPGVVTVSNPQLTTLAVTVNATTENSNPSATQYAIQETTGGLYVQANGSLGASAVWQTAATWATVTVTGLANTTTYTFQAKARNGANVETAFGGTASGTTLTPATVDYNRIQFPNTTQNIDEGGSVTVYARVYEAGITNLSGAQSNLFGWIGYSSTNDNPANAGWTWVPATFNAEYGDDDEYNATIGAGLTPGTYYYAARFQIGTGPYAYGGTGGVWNNDSVTLNVNSNLVDFCNVQFPTTINITEGGSEIVYAQVYEPGVTNSGGQGAGISAWIGYSTTNGTPDNTWTWISATYNTDSGNNDEYQATLGTGLAPGTYYYASRFQKTGSTQYQYGDINGVWNTTADNGVMTITGLETPVATAATSVGAGSFTANWNAVAGATNYELDVYTLTGGTTEVINQTFTWVDLGQTNGTGGNSGGWNGTIATETFDISGWTDVAGYRADNCAKLGAGSTRGSITTPVFGVSGDAVVTFRAGAWNGGSEQTTLLIEVTGGGTLSVSSVTMVKGAFSNYSVNVTGATASTQVTFRAFQASNSRFFIDDINVVVDNLTLTPVSGYNGLLVGNTTSQNVTGLNEGTTYYYVVRAISGSVETVNSNQISATTGYAPVTWTGGAWSNVSGPTNLIDAIIEDVYVTADDGEFTAKSLTVTTGGSLTVSSDDVVTVIGALENELTSSAVVVENNGVLMQGGTSNLNTGSITVRRNSSAILRQDYTLWSSPVAGQGLYAFSPTTLPNRFYTYNTSTNLYSNSVGFNLTGLQYPSPLVAPNGINGTDTNNVSFTTAKGYLIRTPWNHPTAPTVFAGQFAGVPNSGDITYTMSLAGTGFNLVGNPYPSPINMETFVNDNAANITTSLYFWRETNGNTSNNAYCQWNDGLFQSNGQSQVFDPQNVIRTGQGFFVEATGAGTDLVFNNDQRVADTANQFFRQNSTQDVYWLNLTNSEGAFSQAVVSYKDYASNGLDRYDGKNIGTSQVSLTSLIDGQEYGIQGKAAFVDTDVVPMHLKVETAGTYSVSIDHSIGVFTNGQSIYLKDNLLSSLHNLSQGAYSFTSEAGSFANRFEVVYRDAALGVDVPTLTEKQVVIYKNQVNDFVITTGNFEMGTVKVFDVRGRLLLEKQNINATQTTITAGLSNEVLLVQIATTDGTVVTKKVVR